MLDANKRHAAELLSGVAPDPASVFAPIASEASPEQMAELAHNATVQAQQRDLIASATATPEQKAAEESKFLKTAQPDAPAAPPAAPTPQGATAAVGSAAPTPQGAPGTGTDGLPANLITTPADLAVNAAKLRDQGLAGNAQAQHDAKQYSADNIRQAEAEQKVMAPILQSQVDHEQASQKRLQIAQDAIQKQMNEKMLHFQNVQNEMQTMAEEKPKDLFGQAGVNSVMGRIAIFLGGAGMAGLNGPNENLQRIQGMADRNIAAQKNRFDMLSKIGQGDQSMYGMLVQKLGSTQAAEAAMRNSYLSLGEAQTKAALNSFASPRAKLAGEKFLMESADLRRKNDLAVHTGYQNQATQAMGLAQQNETNRINMIRELHKDQLAESKFQLEQYKQQHAEEIYNQENSIGGTMGTVAKSGHDRLAKMAGGYRGMIAMLGDMQHTLEAAPDMETIRAFAIQNAEAFADARSAWEMGTRLEGSEETKATTATLGRLDALFLQMQNAVTKTDALDLMQKIENTQATLTKGAWTKLKTAAPNLKFDRNDQIWGKFDPDTYKPHYQLEHERKHGTHEGQSELSGLGDWKDHQARNMGIAGKALEDRYGPK